MEQNVLAQWITNGADRPFYARKKFTLSEKIRRAEVTVCGLGQFNLYINGKKVGDHVLDPAWSDYRKLIYYLKFDVTEMLAEGENVIAAEVGNGWFIMEQEDGNYTFRFPDFMPPNPNPYVPFAENLMLSLCLHVEFDDGAEKKILTDTYWKIAPHMIESSNVFGSETVNGEKRIKDWNTIICDDSGWASATLLKEDEMPKTLLKLQTMPPVRVIQTYEAKYLHTVNEREIYDLSQNASGMLEFDVMGKRGDVIRIYPAEKLGKDGDVDQFAKNWMDINVCETYIIGEDDTWEHFSMTFTYFCARFLAVEKCAGTIVRNIRLNAISSAGENAGSFYCDDERYMQIYRLIEKAVESNMVSVHTDCPTIERFAWQEENHLMAPAVMYMKKVKSHWEKFLMDTRISQHTKEDYFRDLEGKKFYPGEGLIPAQAPCYIPNVLPVPGMGSFYDVIAWGSTIILGTWWHYRFYGDLHVIAENYEAGKKYLQHLKSRVTEDGFINHGLGDWGNPNGIFARENIETAFLYADAATLKEFAELLGKAEEAGEFLSYAEEIKKNYNEKLLAFNEQTGKYCYRVWDQKDTIAVTPAAQALPLFWGMVPEEKEQDVADSLRKAVEDSGSFQAGEVGQPYIIQAMSKYGMNDLICKVILAKQHPSYYAFVLAGETTLGEYWEENPRSHCHDMMGHIAEWYYNGMAGIQPLEPGFRKVLIRPYLPESVRELKCSYQSASGLIEVSMERVDGKTDLQIQAAPGIETVVDRSFLEE